jgi:hypothetical protein
MDADTARWSLAATSDGSLSVSAVRTVVLSELVTKSIRFTGVVAG